MQKKLVIHLYEVQENKIAVELANNEYEGAHTCAH